MSDPFRLLGNVDENVEKIIRHIRLDMNRYWPDMWVGQGKSSTGGTEHATGRAVDLIISENTGIRATGDRKAQGDRLAAWLWTNSMALGVRGIIWYGQIIGYTKYRGGWGRYSDHGGISANHYDHIHVLFESSVEWPAHAKLTNPGGSVTEDDDMTVDELLRTPIGGSGLTVATAIERAAYSREAVLEAVPQRVLKSKLGASGPTVDVAIQEAYNAGLRHGARLEAIERRLTELEARN